MRSKNIDNIDAYPLEWPDTIRWPREKNPKRSNFYTKTGRYKTRQKTVADAREFLMDELRRLKAKNVVVSTNIKLRKSDGLPYSNRKEPEDSGVAVYFTLKGEQRCIPCDKWDRVADNIYAIGKTIEAMRGIDRWGTPQIIAAAFSGFKALPEAGSGVKWWEELDIAPDARVEEIKKAFGKKAKKYHPDNPHTGDPNKFKRVTLAKEQALQTKT